MFNCKSRYSVISKAIVIVLVCLFIANDIAWAQPASVTPSRSTLAAESRFKPFSDTNEISFRNILTTAYLAREIRDDAVNRQLRDSHIVRFNKRFPKGEVVIYPKIEYGNLPSGIKYAVAVFQFKEKSEKKWAHVLFIKDYANLSPEDLGELKKFGINNVTDVEHLSCPGLEGVWFTKLAPVFLPLNQDENGFFGEDRIIFSEDDRVSLKALAEKVNAAKRNGEFSRSIFTVITARREDRGNAFVVAKEGDYYILLTNAHLVGYRKKVLLKNNVPNGKAIEASVALRFRDSHSGVTGDLAVLVVHEKRLQDLQLVPIDIAIGDIAAGTYDRAIAARVSACNDIVTSGILRYSRFWPCHLPGEVDLKEPVGNNGSGTTARGGDSGSPLLVFKDGKYMVVGINCRVDGSGTLLHFPVINNMLQAFRSPQTKSHFVITSRNRKAVRTVKTFLDKLAAHLDVKSPSPAALATSPVSTAQEYLPPEMRATNLALNASQTPTSSAGTENYPKTGFEIEQDPQKREEIVQRNIAYLKSHDWYEPIEKLPYETKFILNDPKLPEFINQIIERHNVMSGNLLEMTGLDKLLKDVESLTGKRIPTEEYIRKEKPDVNIVIRDNMESFAHLLQSAYYFACFKPEKAQEAFNNYFVAKEKSDNLAMTFGGPSSLTHDHIFGLAHFIYLQGMHDYVRANFLMRVAYILFKHQRRVFLTNYTNFANGFGAVNVWSGKKRGIEALGEALYFSNQYATTELAALARSDTEAGRGLQEHFKHAKEETMKASSFVSESGTAVVLGSGSLMITPLAEMLKETLPSGEFKYNRIILVELAKDYTEPAIKKLIDSKAISAEEAKRVEIVIDDASLVTHNITEEIDAMMLRAEKSENVHEALAKEEEKFLQKISHPANLIKYAMPKKQAFLKEDEKVTFIVFSAALQDFTGSIKQYIEMWLDGFLQWESDWIKFYDQWEKYNDLIEVGLANVVMCNAAEVLTPGGIFLFIDTKDMEQPDKKHGTRKMGSQKYDILEDLPFKLIHYKNGKPAFEKVHSESWIRPVNDSKWSAETGQRFIMGSLVAKKTSSGQSAVSQPEQIKFPPSGRLPPGKEAHFSATPPEFDDLVKETQAKAAKDRVPPNDISNMTRENIERVEVAIRSMKHGLSKILVIRGGLPAIVFFLKKDLPEPQYESWMKFTQDYKDRIARFISRGDNYKSSNLPNLEEASADIIELQQLIEIIREKQSDAKKLHTSFAEEYAESEKLAELQKELDRIANSLQSRLELATVIKCNETVLLSDAIHKAYEENGLSREPWWPRVVKIEAHLPPQTLVKGNILSIANAIYNIIENGKEAIVERHKKDESGKVVISLVQEGDAVRIVIADNGKGIPPELLAIDPVTQRPRLFNLNISQTKGGTGLDTTEAWYAIKDAGGTISVQSELGKGTTFTIRLPLVQPPAAENQGIASRIRIYNLDLETPDEYPEESISGDAVMVAEEDLAIVELHGTEKLFTKGLAGCSALIVHGKKKNGKEVFILSHLVPSYILKNAKTIGNILKQESLQEIEIYIDGFKADEQALEMTLNMIMLDMASVGIEAVIDLSKNTWRARYEIGKVEVDREGITTVHENTPQGMQAFPKMLWAITPAPPVTEEAKADGVAPEAPSPETLVKSIWPEDKYLERRDEIAGKTFLTIHGNNFVLAGNLIFVDKKEWEKKKSQLEKYKDRVIICYLTHANGRAYFEYRYHALLTILFMQAYSHLIKDRVVMDAGSGRDAILAIVAARLGAKKVLAIEADPNLANESRSYLDDNDITNIDITAQYFQRLTIAEKLDVIVANISAADESYILEDGYYHNWHHYLLSKFKPFWYFMCGVRGDERLLDRAKYIIQITGYETMLKKRMVIGDRRSWAYLIQAKPTISQATAAEAAVAEVDRIHTENLKPEYMPTIQDKTILCHIITDSIIPVEQRNILKVELEQAIEKENKHIERIVCLSSANAGNPDEYIKDLQSLIQRKRDEYRALGYADVRFDVACPNKGLVSTILGKNLGVKALAFEPCKEADFNLMQIEGIMLALRALDSGDIEKLRSVFAFLAGNNKLSPEQLAITDIDTFIKTVSFILPVAKIEDYNERRKANDLITNNIKQAA